eukprot:2362190-Pyramimonas_sp.AAC.1
MPPQDPRGAAAANQESWKLSGGMALAIIKSCGGGIRRMRASAAGAAASRRQGRPADNSMLQREDQARH